MRYMYKIDMRGGGRAIVETKNHSLENYHLTFKLSEVIAVKVVNKVSFII